MIQFSRPKVAANLFIVAVSIYVERFTGRARDSSILNNDLANSKN